MEEGDTITVTVTANGKTGGRVEVQIAVTGDATVSNLLGDFDVAQLGSILFNIGVGSTTASADWRVNDDSHREDDEDIIFSIPADANIFPTGATPATWSRGTPSSVTVTILASDQISRTLTVTAPSPATVSEGAGATFTVGIAGTAFTNPTAVTWTVTPGTAAAADFVAVTDSIMFPTMTTFTVNTVDDALVESAETFTVQISVADTTADGGTGIGAATGDISITDNDTAGLVISSSAVSVPEGGTETYTVQLATQPTTAAGTVTVTVAGGSGGTVIMPVSETLMFTAANWDTAQTVTVMAHADAAIGDTAMLTHTVGGMGEYANADGMLDATVTVRIVAVPVIAPGEPPAETAARTTRVTTQLAGFAKAATQLTAQAVSQRLNFSGNSAFNLGHGATAEDILRQSSFSLAHGNGGINLWAFGNRSKVSGDDNGVRYKGDATAWHLGADTAWNNGLLGITIGQSAGDFTDTDTNSRLESSIVSVHPYLTRTVRGTKLWATIGYGTGEAELRETDGADTYRGDAGLSLLTAAASIALVVGDNAAFTAAAQWSKTEWDAATLTAGDRTRMLPKGDASTLRLDGGAELGKRFGDWRPFLTVNIRRDSGDGDDGNAADYGGGVEWQSNNVHLRLAGRKHAQGRGPDEEHLTLTARKTAGKLNLGLNLSADDGVNTGNLLTGELRF